MLFWAEDLLLPSEGPRARGNDERKVVSAPGITGVAQLAPVEGSVPCA